jgi:hypothetical protein
LTPTDYYDCAKNLTLPGVNEGTFIFSTDSYKVGKSYVISGKTCQPNLPHAIASVCTLIFCSDLI